MAQYAQSHRLEERLTANGFLRVHRSALVRLGAAVTLGASGSDVQLVLTSGARVKVARERIAAVRAWLFPADL